MKCEGFGGTCERTDAIRYRTLTAYEDDEKNFMNLCPDCQKESDAYYEELWREMAKEY